MSHLFYEETNLKIYNADCREVQDLDGFDLILTDPPYNIKHLGGRGLGKDREMYTGGKLKGMMDFALDDFRPVLLKAPMLISFCSRDGIIQYTDLARHVDRTFDLHVWYKTNAIPFTNNTFKSDLEYICLIYEKFPGWRQFDQAYHSKVWQSPIVPGQQKLHPTQKPLGLIKKYLNILNPKKVLDPFMGGGTALVACKELGIECVGIEKEEKYCEAAVKRLSQNVLNLE